MSIQSINSTGSIGFKSTEQKTGVNKPSKSPEEIKDGKKKLALALGALAVAGAVTAGIVITKGKKPALPVNNEKTQDGLNEIIDAGKEKIKGLVKKEKLPFDYNTEIILNKENEKIAIKDTVAKYNAQYNGKDVIVEEKLVNAKNLNRAYSNYAFIKDPKTGKTLEIKRLTLEGNEITPEMKKFRQAKKAAVDNILKTAEKTVDENGNKVTKTYKNGKLHSTQTTIVNPDNSRQIIIEYGDNGSKGYKKIIDIAADGTKKITEQGKRLFDL